MFGFLRVQKDRLDAEAQGDYRAHFCAGCQALRATGGRSASLLTNYDQTFLALVVAALDERRRAAPVLRVPCTALPLRRVRVQPLRPDDRRFLAYATLALVGAKLDDDVADGEGFGRRIARRLLGRRIRRAYRALLNDGFPTDVLARLPARQHTAERAVAPSLDSLTSPTEAALSAIFAHAARRGGRPDLVVPLTDAGAALARVIYLFDAWEDRRRDRARGRFNAIDALVRSGERIGLTADQTTAALHGVVETAVDSLATVVLALPDGPQRPVLTGVVATLRARATRLARDGDPAPLPSPHRLATQRGDCDCGGCDCDCCCDVGDCNACRFCDCCYCCGTSDDEGRRAASRRRRDRQADEEEDPANESTPPA